MTAGTPFSLSQLNAIRSAYATGALRVTHEGRTTEFRTLADMRAIIVQMEGELGAGVDTTPPTRRLRMVGTKGLC